MNYIILTFFILALTGCSSAHKIDPFTTRGPASVKDGDNYVKKNMIFMTTDCSLSIINMTTGKLVVGKGDAGSTVCIPGEPFSADCTFFDSKGKEIITKKMVSALSGQEAIISSENQSDTIIFNLVTRNFYQAANIYADHGTGRGQKTCAGSFIYGEEIEKLNTKSVNVKYKKELERAPASAKRVRGHIKSNGTYVGPYIRTSPNSTTYDNIRR